MEKTIIIDERPVVFKSTGAFLLRYKAQFGRDAIRDLARLSEAIDADGKMKDVDTFDLEVFFNMAWTLAKTADPSIQNQFEWLDTFSEFPIMDVVPELMELFESSIRSSKKK